MGRGGGGGTDFIDVGEGCWLMDGMLVMNRFWKYVCYLVVCVDVESYVS
jgi:hypothetical protein